METFKILAVSDKSATSSVGSLTLWADSKALPLRTYPPLNLETGSFLWVEEEEDSWRGVAVPTNLQLRYFPKRRGGWGWASIYLWFNHLRPRGTHTLGRAVLWLNSILVGFQVSRAVFREEWGLLALGGHCDQSVKRKSLSWCFLASGPSPPLNPLVSLGDCLMLIIFLACAIAHTSRWHR